MSIEGVLITGGAADLSAAAVRGRIRRLVVASSEDAARKAELTMNAHARVSCRTRSKGGELRCA